MWYFFFAADYIKGLAIKVSDRKPVIGTTPNFDRYAGYRVCGEYPGTPKISTDITITCGSNPIGRYVYAHVPGNSYLQMCEVQVFGKSKYTAGLSNGSVQTKCNSLTMLLRLFSLRCKVPEL